MSWADKVKATALAALAERTASAGHIPADASTDWNCPDVWLTRIKQPRNLAEHDHGKLRRGAELPLPG